ncbi:MAG: hypothetical protein Q9182_006728 [Xanthomendoza sp. 2 TL-2023]
MSTNRRHVGTIGVISLRLPVHEVQPYEPDNPLASKNYIKSQAREHPRFRRLCISGAQRVHRLDMSLRLGLLQDHAAIDKQIAKEAAEAHAKKQKPVEPAVKTEAQTKADERLATKEKEKVPEKSKPTSKPRIRPLSEAKAIDAGATFASETFLLGVGIGLIIFERWWSSRKESTRREDVSDRIVELEESERAARRALVELEKELLRIRAKEGKDKSSKRILPKEIWEAEEREEDERRPNTSSLLSWFRWPRLSGRTEPRQQTLEARPQEGTAPNTSNDAIVTEKPATQNMTVWPFAESGPPLREAILTTHDLALPIPAARSTMEFNQQQTSVQQQHLFLLLTPISVSDANRTSTLARIERFATLVTDPSPAIAFLLFAEPPQSSSSNGFHSYMTLQTLLHGLAISPPMLPIASASQLIPSLNTYVASSVIKHPMMALPSSRTLLQQITATGPTCPLSEHSTNVLSDICHSIKEVAAMTESDQGMKVLEDFLGEDAKKIESFWAEEWICE